MTFGRPSTYNLGPMEVGETIELPAPTKADVHRIARNVSIYGIRHDRQYRCRTDKVRRVTVILRVR